MDSRDDAVVAHRETVRVFARPGGPLAPDSPHATMNNPAWFVEHDPRHPPQVLGPSRLPRSTT